MDKIVLTLNKEEFMELQEILIDEDAEASLKFLQKCIAPRIPVKGTAPCDSSRINPFLLNSKHKTNSEDK